jgi:DNA mismatch endonuclease (patch repair protein)
MPVPRFTGLQPRSDRTSKIARSVVARDSRAELALREALWSMGLRYRIHWPQLVGRPDIVFTGARLVVFVDGDFWHGRNWQTRRRRLSRGNNADYWTAKIESNTRRDRRQTKALERQGWRVLRFWEGEVLKNALAVARSVAIVVEEQRIGQRRRAALVRAAVLDWSEPP